ncbi:hypothetical protein [Simkania negevensis]|uniref:Uncharacterized protein n=1 Tax=Simkania negevensis (strain ATCC VR-1471 / DSM 27360 / Z) TaxID=331113 RepID=F8L575_SIMNZ|nr:hypothetical protein [Simkania negevensis]CCB87956.1 hypothetical protein SNE_A00780 [Simkania negevensis Z]
MSQATHNLAADLFECGAGYYGVHTPPVQHLKNTWRHFILTHGPDEKFLQTCQSGGAIHVKNALLTSPESVRKRIIVIAIAPGAIVPEELCFKSYNYMSKRDFVSYCDLIIGGNIKYINELKLLDPHPDAKFFDHDFLRTVLKKSIFVDSPPLIINRIKLSEAFDSAFCI